MFSHKMHKNSYEEPKLLSIQRSGKVASLIENVTRKANIE